MPVNKKPKWNRTKPVELNQISRDNGKILWVLVQIAENRAYAIQLMADGANLSTLLHELGHVALNELNWLNEMGMTEDNLSADMGELRNFIGLKEGDNLAGKTPECGRHMKNLPADG